MPHRITIEDVRPNLLEDERVSPFYNNLVREYVDDITLDTKRTIYARQNNGTVWRFHKRIATRHVCTFVAAVLCKGNIDPELWTVVCKGMTQIEMSFDHNQQEAA